MRTRKVIENTAIGQTPTMSAPRLVKAAELVAREIVKSIPRAPKPVARPTRTPRTASEARELFKTLFGETANA